MSRRGLASGRILALYASVRLALSCTLEDQVYRHHLAVCTLIRCFRIYPPRDAARWQRTLVRCLTATLLWNGSSVATVPQRSSPNAPNPREPLKY